MDPNGQIENEIALRLIVSKNAPFVWRNLYGTAETIIKNESSHMFAMSTNLLYCCETWTVRGYPPLKFMPKEHFTYFCEWIKARMIARTSAM